MAYRKLYQPWLCFIVLQILLLQTGCTKEYSYEGGVQIIRIDSSFTPPVSVFPTCSACNASAELALGNWNFKTGRSFVCGVVTNAGFIGQRQTFTFFGPSDCSLDTGLVMTVYLPLVFDEDKFNITTNSAAFFYYDRTAAHDIFISQPAAPFSLTVDSFIYDTGIAIGTFSGTVFKPNGDQAYISDGKFKIKLK